MRYLMICLMVVGFALAGCYAEEGAVTQNYTVEGPVIIVASPEEATQVAKELEAQKVESHEPYHIKISLLKREGLPDCVEWSIKYENEEFPKLLNIDKLDDFQSNPRTDLLGAHGSGLMRRPPTSVRLVGVTAPTRFVEKCNELGVRIEYEDAIAPSKIE